MSQQFLSLGPPRGVAAANQFRPERLQLAREAAGLQRNELAERLDLSASAVGQFEGGRARPAPETVLRLALALGVPPEFFAGPAPVLVPAEQCHFRRQRGSAQAEQRRVRALGALALELVEHLDTRVEWPPERLSTLAHPLDRASDEEAAAAAVREAWGLGDGPLADVVGLLEREGVVVLEAAGHSARLDAFSAWVEQRPVVFLSTDKQSGSRRRFDAAHEFAHLLLHAGRTPGETGTERAADRFASALLLPREAFAAECPRRLVWAELRALKRRWKVSLAALVRRAHTVGIYSEATYRRACVQLNRRGWREREPDEPPLERPRTLMRALVLLQQAGCPPEDIAATLGLPPAPLLGLLRGEAFHWSTAGAAE